MQLKQGRPCYEKIFGLLIFPILGASVHTYAQEEYDQQIFQYINQEKWFDAKSLYDTRHDDLSEVIRLISGAFLGAYFNRPAEGVSAIEELLAKYGGQLGGQAVMYRMLAAKNFASVRAYAKWILYSPICWPTTPPTSTTRPGRGLPRG